MAFGVLPSPGPPGGVSMISLMTRRVFVSTTEIRSVLADATKRRDPSALSVIADGCRPTRMRMPAASVPLAPGVNADTLVPPQDETYTAPFFATATP